MLGQYRRKSVYIGPTGRQGAILERDNALSVLFDRLEHGGMLVLGQVPHMLHVEAVPHLTCVAPYKKNTTAAIADIFSAHSAELPAACGIYARAFKFLCQAADIPCITITTATHGWNLVYVDGQWLHVDVSTNDVNNRHVILLAGTVSNRTDTAPEATAFLKELLVPESTK